MVRISQYVYNKYSFVISRFHCKERKIGLTPLSQFAHSHPFESRIIPSPPPPPNQFSLAEVQSYPALLDCSTCTWQFNSYSTIISGVNSLLFRKIGGVTASGVHLPIIKCPVHHSIHSPLFFRTIVGIEDSALRRPSWIGKARRPLPRFT